MAIRPHIIALACLVSFAATASALNCYNCTNIGTPPTPGCNDPEKDGNVKFIGCNPGACVAVKNIDSRNTSQVDFFRQCVGPEHMNSDIMPVGTCMKMEMNLTKTSSLDMTICVCDGQLCNGRNDFANATDSATSIACHMSVTGAPNTTDIVGTGTCSTGSCIRYKASDANKMVVTAQSCIPVTINGCYSGLPDVIAPFVRIQPGFTVKGFCGCSTAMCNDDTCSTDTCSGTGRIQLTVWIPIVLTMFLACMSALI